MDLRELIIAMSLPVMFNGSCKQEYIVKTLTDNTFYEGISEGTTVVEFCGASNYNCAEDITNFFIMAGGHEGQANFAYYDCDSGKICDRYGIRSQPVYIVFKNGQNIIRYDELTSDSLETAIE